MRILVFSDTHGYMIDGCNIIERYLKDGGIDAIIHAGDVVYDEDYIKSKYPDIPLYAVCGNNDFFSDYPYDLTVTLGGKKIFITHGHNYNVRLGNDKLKELMMKEGIDLVIYGHTHNPEHDYCGTGQIINPGSLFFGRTYAVVDIENGSINAEIKEEK